VSNCLNFCRSIEHPTYSALTRPLCELSSLVPPQVLATHRKLRVISSLLLTFFEFDKAKAAQVVVDFVFIVDEILEFYHVSYRFFLPASCILCQ